VTSKNLPNDPLGAVNPLGELCFDEQQGKVLYRNEILALNDGELRFVWWLLKEPRGLSTSQLLERCWHNGNPPQLHKAAHTLRKYTKFEALIQHHGTYRLNAKFFTSIPVPFEESIRMWRERAFLPVAEFVDLVFQPESSGGRPETLIYAADAQALLRANPAKFADSIRAGRTFFIVTSQGTTEQLPRLLHSLFQEVQHDEDPVALLRGALTIVIAPPQSGFATAPVYFLDSHDPNRCVQFTLRSRNTEAVLLEHGDDASVNAETLRANFLSLEDEGMLCLQGNVAALRMLQAGIRHAFRSFDSAELTEKLLSACFDPPARILAQNAVSPSRLSQVESHVPNVSSVATAGRAAARQST